MTAPRGLYDQLLTESLQRSLARDSAEARLRALAPEEAAERFADEIRRQLGRLLSDLPDQGDLRSLRQLDLFNSLLNELRAAYPSSEALLDPVPAPARIVHSIHDAGLPGLPGPDTGLSSPWLFTAGRGSPTLLNELRQEAAACEQIDILVSFITMSGVRKLMDVLEAATAADATGAGRTRIRVLTTTYTGATELGALDELARLNGCQVKISLDGRRTRLHAKAWIFGRDSGFGSAYVGSANLSGAALMGGLEWTVKFTQRGQGSLFDRARAHFETLWLDPEFTDFRSGDPECRSAVAAALNREGGSGGTGTGFYFDIQPKHYQKEILNALAYEREHGRNRSLLVAATGTGKTVVAALDYREICNQLHHRPRLLFVAHRAQILRQALRTYREVLRDGSFGELLTGGLEPASHDHLFATIDSLDSRDLVALRGKHYWHTVVIDECHRLAAARFDRLVTSIAPSYLLGLTATPERTDGRPISPYFDPRPDGSPAAELRLWDALDMQLVAPFEYFGCDDDTDFTEVPWNSAGETAAIDRIVVGDERRARLVIREWARLSGNPTGSRALVFCVSVAHAQFMTRQFNAAGLPAMCVIGDTPQAERLRAPRLLAEGKVCALVTVDLYNEGVDLPEVNTLILLRPTQSPVLFQQQIGRGLRLAPGKESCLVLDFVGHHRAEFRFDHLLGGITGLTRRELIDSVEHGFSSLAPGCHIQLQARTREQVLRNLRSFVNQSWRRLSSELASYVAIRGKPDVKLGEFLHDQRIDPREIYRSSAPAGWSALRRSAGLAAPPETPGEADLSRSFRHLLHIDDLAQLDAIRRIAESPATYQPSGAADRLRAQMLTYQIDVGHGPVGYDEITGQLEANPACGAELHQLVDVLAARSRLDRRELPGAADVPLALHGSYRIREILTAFGFMTNLRRTPFQAGVLALRDRRCELMFVTLDKSDGFHDRIAYHDYAASPTRFHWQTQNSAGPDTPAGRRYAQSATNGWTFQLFVRGQKKDPYHACGPVYLASPEDLSGDRPMSINWTLEVPLPARLFAEFSVLRA
jgi:superfamily II DNA or RNA helicase/HKD family nuclease